MKLTCFPVLVLVSMFLCNDAGQVPTNRHRRKIKDFEKRNLTIHSKLKEKGYIKFPVYKEYIKDGFAHYDLYTINLNRHYDVTPDVFKYVDKCPTNCTDPVTQRTLMPHELYEVMPIEKEINVTPIGRTESTKQPTNFSLKLTMACTCRKKTTP